MGKDYGRNGKIDLSDRNQPNTKEIELIGSDKRVLDVGCHVGLVARELVRRGCTVTGIELDREAADIASACCESVVVGDVEQFDLLQLFRNESFDVVLLGNVLEHLKDPGKVLTQARYLLGPGGFVVVSVPNVAHVSIRLMLLEGRFDYEELGILDDTHLKYFTRKSIKDLLESCGYLVDAFDWVDAPISAERLHEVLDPMGLTDIEAVVRAFSDWEASAFIYVIRAFPATEQERLQELSEKKTQAEMRLRYLEEEIAGLKNLNDELSVEAAAVKKVADSAAVYARSLEKALGEKDDYIARLERVHDESCRGQATPAKRKGRFGRILEGRRPASPDNDRSNAVAETDGETGFD